MIKEIFSTATDKIKITIISQEVENNEKICM